jgi:hypothetical protein
MFCVLASLLATVGYDCGPRHLSTTFLRNALFVDYNDQQKRRSARRGEGHSPVLNNGYTWVTDVFERGQMFTQSSNRGAQQGAWKNKVAHRTATQHTTGTDRSIAGVMALGGNSIHDLRVRKR